MLAYNDVKSLSGFQYHFIWPNWHLRLRQEICVDQSWLKMGVPLVAWKSFRLNQFPSRATTTHFTITPIAITYFPWREILCGMSFSISSNKISQPDIHGISWWKKGKGATTLRVWHSLEENSFPGLNLHICKTSSVWVFFVMEWCVLQHQKSSACSYIPLWDPLYIYIYSCVVAFSCWKVNLGVAEIINKTCLETFKYCILHQAWMLVDNLGTPYCLLFDFCCWIFNLLQYNITTGTMGLSCKYGGKRHFSCSEILLKEITTLQMP